MKKEFVNRVVLNIPNDFYKNFESLAFRRGISVSSLIRFSMSWFLENCKGVVI